MCFWTAERFTPNFSVNSVIVNLGFSAINSYVSIYLTVNPLVEYPPTWLKYERIQINIFQVNN